MNVSNFILMHDAWTNERVASRLYFTMNGDERAATTANTVYATDPLRAIRTPLEWLKVSPTDPPSRKVEMMAGILYDSGDIYSARAIRTADLDIGGPALVYILIGLTIDRVKNEISTYVEQRKSQIPIIPANVFPCALIRVPPDTTKIVSDHIVDIRPWLNFDVAHPKDRVVIEIGCLAPGDSQMFSYKPFHSGPPFMMFYTRSPNDGIRTITHLYDSEEKIQDLVDTPAYYDASKGGITITPVINAIPLSVSASPNVIFVSAARGNPSIADGTIDRPFLRLQDAVDRLNGMPGYDTIFLSEGVYQIFGSALVMDKSVTLIGEDPNKVIINAVTDSGIATLRAETTFRTIQFQWSVSSVTAGWIITAEDVVRFYNCIFRPITQNPTAQFLNNATDRYISNCIIYNSYPFASPQPRFFTPRVLSDPWNERTENNVIIGLWAHLFPNGGSMNVFDPTMDMSSTGMEDLRNFYLKDGSPLIDAGNFTLVGMDVDGSRTDIGLYGGQYAAMARILTYPLDSKPVFRYAFQTMFAPSMDHFLEVIPGIPVVPNTQIYAAVSFNGGRKWLAWNELLGAWGVVDLTKIDTQGNTWDELCRRVVQMGSITTPGEIAFAWGLTTSNIKNTPIIKDAFFKVKSDGQALKPIHPDNLDILVSPGSVLITNIGTDRIEDLIVVVN